MNEDVRSAIRRASETILKPLEPAGKLARDLTRRGRGPAGQLADRGREYAESIRSVVRGEIRRQLESMGLATKDDLADLERRIAALESGRRPAEPSSARAGAKPAARKPRTPTATPKSKKGPPV